MSTFAKAVLILLCVLVVALLLAHYAAMASGAAWGTPGYGARVAFACFAWGLFGPMLTMIGVESDRPPKYTDYPGP